MAGTLLERRRSMQVGTFVLLYIFLLPQFVVFVPIAGSSSSSSSSASKVLLARIVTVQDQKEYRQNETRWVPYVGNQPVGTQYVIVSHGLTHSTCRRYYVLLLLLLLLFFGEDDDYVDVDDVAGAT